MKVMLLAAGRGERMRPLTDEIPKPLLTVNKKPLIEYHLEKLACAGFHDVVINVSYRAQQIIDALGTGERFGLNIEYSREYPRPLETAGGIKKALPLIGSEPFAVINSDIWTDYDFTCLKNLSPTHAHLVLIDNPPHNPNGDFYFENDRCVLHSSQRLTFSGISVFNPNFFSKVTENFSRLGVLLKKEIANETLIFAEYFGGEWRDVGTPDALRSLRDLFR